MSFKKYHFDFQKVRDQNCAERSQRWPDPLNDSVNNAEAEFVAYQAAEISLQLLQWSRFKRDPQRQRSEPSDGHTHTEIFTETLVF